MPTGFRLDNNLQRVAELAMATSTNNRQVNLSVVELKRFKELLNAILRDCFAQFLDGACRRWTGFPAENAEGPIELVCC